MSRMVLVIVAVVCIAFVGGIASLGLSGHAPVPQPVHRDIPLQVPQQAVQAPTTPVPPPPPAPLVTPLSPAPQGAPVTPAPAAH